ncbi:hypothetical protein MOSE0_I06788 [Monosporozyma servazzii]
MTQSNYSFDNSSGPSTTVLPSTNTTITPVTAPTATATSSSINNNTENNNIENININSNNSSSNNNNVGPRTLLHRVLDNNTSKNASRQPSISIGTTYSLLTDNTNNLNSNQLRLQRGLSQQYQSQSPFYPTTSYLNATTTSNNNNNTSQYQPQYQPQYAYTQGYIQKFNTPSSSQSFPSDDFSYDNGKNNINTNPTSLSSRSPLIYDYKNNYTPQPNRLNEFNVSNQSNNNTNNNNNDINNVNKINGNNNHTNFLSFINNPMLKSNNSLVNYNNYIPGNSPIIQRPSQQYHQARLSTSSQHSYQPNIMNVPSKIHPNIKIEPSNQYISNHSLSFSGPTPSYPANISSSDLSTQTSFTVPQYSEQPRLSYSQSINLHNPSISSNVSTVCNSNNNIPIIINSSKNILFSNTTNSTSSLPSSSSSSSALVVNSPTTSSKTENNNNELSSANLTSIINSDLSPNSNYSNLNTPSQATKTPDIANTSSVYTTSSSSTNEVTPEFIFKCQLCDKSFKRKSWLKRHLLSHSNERHFLCQWCSSKHKRKDNILQHMKLKHPKYLLQELKMANVTFKWQKSKSLNFDNIPDEKRLEYVDSIKTLLYQDILSKEDVNRVLNNIIKRSH